MILSNNYFSSVSVFDARSREYHDACDASDAADAGAGVLMETDMEEKKLLNKVIIFCFLCAQKVFS